MARRRKPRLGDWQPRGFKRTYYHYAPRTAADAVRTRTTVVGYKNPFHEGIHEVMYEAAHTSKAACKLLARNGCPGPREVVSDRRQQAKNLAEARSENRFRFLAALCDKRGEERAAEKRASASIS